MEVYNMSKKRAKMLTPYVLHPDIKNREASLFIMPVANNKSDSFTLLKKFNKNQGIEFSNKLYTVQAIHDNYKNINIKEFVLPKKIVTISGSIVGISIPLIKSVGFGQYLNDLNIPLENKIEKLKQIGKILDDMKKIRKDCVLKDFYINDLREDNFIIEKSTGNLRVVDLDSIKIADNHPFLAAYLFDCTQLDKLPDKYDVYYKAMGAACNINEQTDLYCYIMMIINFIYNYNGVYKMPLEEYYDYLSYLNNIGLSSELLSVFENVYTSKLNVNPYEILDSIKDVYPKSIKNIYQVVRHK